MDIFNNMKDVLLIWRTVSCAWLIVDAEKGVQQNRSVSAMFSFSNRTTQTHYFNCRINFSKDFIISSAISYNIVTVLYIKFIAMLCLNNSSRNFEFTNSRQPNIFVSFVTFMLSRWWEKKWISSCSLECS